MVTGGENVTEEKKKLNMYVHSVQKRHYREAKIVRIHVVELLLQ